VQDQQKLKFLDWRPEFVKLFAITIVIIFHIYFYTAHLVSGYTNPLVLLGGIAIGGFMVCSGYVHGLKEEFTQGSPILPRDYGNYLKKRFLRLFIGYYIALLLVFGAKLVAGFSIVVSSSETLVYGFSNPIYITPQSLALDLSGLWPLLTGNSGGIWPEGWFISAIMILCMLYPFLRKLYASRKNLFYLLIGLTIGIRIVVVLWFDPNWAYYFPLAWTAEFSTGIIIGNYVRKINRPQPSLSSYQKIIIQVAARVWPLYLVHIAVVIFLPYTISLWQILLAAGAIILLAEIFFRILRLINTRFENRPEQSYAPFKLTSNPRKLV